MGVATDPHSMLGFSSTHHRPMTYKIIRFHITKGNRVICRGLTLEEAQAHCRNPKTRKEGVWFDGYDEE